MNNRDQVVFLVPQQSVYTYMEGVKEKYNRDQIVFPVPQQSVYIHFRMDSMMILMQQQQFQLIYKILH